MLRMIAVFLVIVVFAASGFTAELVSMKLCSTKDYDSAAKDCVAGKGMEGRLDLRKILVDGVGLRLDDKTSSSGGVGRNDLVEGTED
jgi:hypothetical protein